MALADWFRSNEGRAVAALERLVQLYELDLRSRGIYTEDAGEEGEVLETSQALLAKLEAENEYRRAHGLGASAAIGALNPLTGQPWGAGELSISSEEEAGTPEEDAYLGGRGDSSYASLFGSGNSWGWGAGPEGAEEAEPRTPESGGSQLGTSGPPSRFGYRPQPEGQGGADSGEESIGGGELGGSAAGEEAGEPAK